MSSCRTERTTSSHPKQEMGIYGTIVDGRLCLQAKAKQISDERPKGI
jgi:hypothetical protein